MLTFIELWEKLVSQDETVEIEAKSASDIGKSILETVSAFANEPGRGGGTLGRHPRRTQKSTVSITV
jgi:ATP-dependent DNA helicase RecG